MPVHELREVGCTCTHERDRTFRYWWCRDERTRAAPSFLFGVEPKHHNRSTNRLLHKATRQLEHAGRAGRVVVGAGTHEEAVLWVGDVVQ